MRDYTFLNGARFSINNLFRSLRFDIDRLDLSWVDSDKPDFTRGLRIVDHVEINTITVDGEDADNLIYSLTYLYPIVRKTSPFRARMNSTDSLSVLDISILFK